MIPTTRESHTYYIRKSGKTRIYMSIETEETAFSRFVNKLLENDGCLLKQKTLGLALVVVGIVGCFIMTEDCGGCLFAGFMGACRLFSNYVR